MKGRVETQQLGLFVVVGLVNTGIDAGLLQKAAISA